MQNNDLLFFNKTINVDLKNILTNPDGLTASFIQSTITALTISKENIIGNFNTRLYESISEKKQIGPYIQFYQRELIRLSDDILRYSFKEENICYEEQEINHFIEFIGNALQEMLNFLYREYPRFIDPGCRIPAREVPALSDKLTDRLSTIQEAFQRKDIDPVLSDILFDPFFAFQTDYMGNTHITLSEAEYLLVLQEELLRFTEDERGEINPVYLLNTRLLSINFNYWKYVNYFIEFIEKELSLLDDPDERLVTVILLQKQLAQLPEKTGGYKPQDVSLKNQLLNWLNVEIHYCESRKRLNSLEQPSKKVHKWDGFKIDTGMSVAEIGYLMALMLKNEMVNNTNKNKLAEFVAYFFTSKRRSTIAAHSLRNTMYTDNAGVARSVRDKILKLLKNSRS